MTLKDEIRDHARGIADELLIGEMEFVDYKRKIEGYDIGFSDYHVADLEWDEIIELADQALDEYGYDYLEGSGLTLKWRLRGMATNGLTMRVRAKLAEDIAYIENCHGTRLYIRDDDNFEVDGEEEIWIAEDISGLTVYVADKDEINEIREKAEEETK